MPRGAPAAVAALCAALPSAAGRKYILQVLADDLGYDDVNWRNGQTITPTLDGLVKEGVEIKEFYSYKMCAPARGTLLSGRYPMRLGIYNKNYGDFDLRIKLLPAALKEGKGDLEWATHALGKWHLGWTYINYTATQRGFDTFFGSSGNTADYWKHTQHGPEYSKCDGVDPSVDPKDFIDVKGNQFQVADEGVFGEYDSTVLCGRALRIIQDHDLSQGLYLYLAFHNVHKPQNAPLATVQRYGTTRDDGRKVSDAQLTELDTGVGNITALMKQRGMWDQTLVLFHSDNGGPTSHACNNPLRGGKFTFWEGGVRVAAFASGGAIPSGRRGTQFDGVAHASDWYATAASFGGVQLGDTGPLPLDSIDLWGAITGGTASPRMEVLHLPTNVNNLPGAVFADVCKKKTGQGCSPAIRVGRYKLIVGDPGDNEVCTNTPLQKDTVPFGKTGGVLSDGTHCSGGHWKPTWTPGTDDCKPHCLFDVVADPSEANDLSSNASLAGTLASLQQRLGELSKEGQQPDPVTELSNGQWKPQVCKIFAQTGFWLPMDWDVGPSPPAPPSPPGPGPAPTPPPSPPAPVPASCDAACTAACPRAQYPDYDSCLTCTRSNATVTAACKPKQRQTYCH